MKHSIFSILRKLLTLKKMETKPLELKWHVVYTLSKAEKKVASRISSMGLESYLPLNRVTRKWSDRIKKLDVPLFPNYVFVKVSPEKRGYLYSIKEMVRFVSIEKKPVVVRDKEISAIKRVLGEEVEVFPEEYFQQGMNIRIKYGQFAGLEGVVVRKSNYSRLVIRIDGLMKAFSINVSSNLAEPVC